MSDQTVVAVNILVPLLAHSVARCILLLSTYYRTQISPHTQDSRPVFSTQFALALKEFNRTEKPYY